MKIKHGLFNPGLTPIIKGIAIILMFATHVLRFDWMEFPEMVVDVAIAGKPLASIIGRTGDICIGIFSFVTGYGWCSGFSSKSIPQRLFKGGIYQSYYVVMLLFCLPALLINNYFLGAPLIPPYDLVDILKSLLAISSKSVTYCWYVSFFAMAVITYGPLKKMLIGWKAKGILKVMCVCCIGLGMRLCTRILEKFGIISDDLLGILSHYFQWMPVVLTGTISRAHGLLENIDNFVIAHFGRQKRRLTAVVAVAAIIGVKVLMQFGMNIYSNVDSLLMLPFMYGLIVLAQALYDDYKWAADILSFLGDTSLYLWLGHCVLQYVPVQGLLFQLRFPLLILAGALTVMSPVGYALRIIDKKLSAFLNNKTPTYTSR